MDDRLIRTMDNCNLQWVLTAQQFKENRKTKSSLMSENQIELDYSDYYDDDDDNCDDVNDDDDGDDDGYDDGGDNDDDNDRIKRPNYDH
ncbi:hypothetical protein Glove_168g3 [Diversispora epigaea]|uniref:Uncharacterized protein n=1 Tax=Diversispora epigaea TaxID=1348612 RepID=A0A397IZ43_9GLOM|nr:hypothetical protein Glove_168g3 [Diversispora epigaea]